jgi:hypothetical protein
MNLAFNDESFTIRISFRTDDYSMSFHISNRNTFHGDDLIVYLGRGSNNKELKKNFIKLFNKIHDQFQLQTLTKERQVFLEKIQTIFPDMYDRLLLEDYNEEEKRDS